MEKEIIVCSNCGQKLSVPKGVGGVTMQCPQCGQKFSKGFVVKSGGKTVGAGRKAREVKPLGKGSASPGGEPAMKWMWYGLAVIGVSMLLMFITR